MITLHYLKQSCSHRIVWLLEALGLDYELKIYDRLEGTGFAPAELKAQHPLGKAPVLQDGDLVLAEGNAIIQHLFDRYDTENRFTPAHKTDAYSNYVYWLAISASMFSANLLALVSRKGDLGGFARASGFIFQSRRTIARRQNLDRRRTTHWRRFCVKFPITMGIKLCEQSGFPKYHPLPRTNRNPPSLSQSE